MNILERFRIVSPLLRGAQALLCAVFLLNLAAHFSHHHEAKPDVSAERLTCAHCCTFSGVISAREPASLPPRTAAFGTLVSIPAEQRFVQRRAAAQWARGPPSICQASSMPFS